MAYTFSQFYVGKNYETNIGAKFVNFNLGDTNTKVFYWCNECYTTFHTECVLSEDPYIKPGQQYRLRGWEIEILGIGNLSRPLCGFCKKRCRNKIFKGNTRFWWRKNYIACSTECCRMILNN